LHLFPDVIWSILLIISCMLFMLGLVSSYRNEAHTPAINNGETKSLMGLGFS